jgi:hypothetical protein
VSTLLYGPFPFDEQVVVASARAALAVVTGLIRDGLSADILASEATGEEPGLYVTVLADAKGNPLISGFWITFGSTYTDRGPAGPPDRQPPFALKLLDAVTEEVWWKNLPVTKSKGGRWRPALIFEWPQFLASRSALSPPGIPANFSEDAFEEDQDATWLDEVTSDLPLPVTEVEVEFEDEEGNFGTDEWDELPLERSLIMVVQGMLDKGTAIHRGTFGLVAPGTFQSGARVTALSDWFDVLGAGAVPTLHEEQEANDVPRLGGPLELPGGRVGFHALGWLTKNLESWPIRASDIRRGTLNDRVVRSRWQGQLATAVSSSIIVLTLVVSVAFAIRQAATPRPEASPEPPPSAAQPAMAQCSAEHTQFVEEFRCQVKALAEGGSIALQTPWCGDTTEELVTNARPLPSEDLQAAYCGLLDRTEQGWVGRFQAGEGSYEVDWAEFAAAQACFNVLGVPYGYEMRQDDRRRRVANPASFFDDVSLRVEPLAQLVNDLELACDAYRDRMEARVEGAVFATHIGDARGSSTARKSLRELATDYALVGVPDELAQCFKEGMKNGLEVDEYYGMCTTGGSVPDSADREFGELHIWQKLGKGPAYTSVAGRGLIERYGTARFGIPTDVPDDVDITSFVDRQVSRATEVWQCHMGMTGRYAAGAAPGESALGKWEVRLPLPSSYNVSGSGARSQLQLDSALIPMRDDGLSVGICWDVVSKRLTQYTPVHPLLTVPDGNSWPSAEQQLCGQVCSAYYGISKSSMDDQWTTPGGDLDLCVTGARLPSSASARAGLGRGRLDQLRIPYYSEPVSGNRYRWLEPKLSDVCAFNLVAQNLIPGNPDGYIVGGRAPEEWAGRASEGSTIAGGAGKAIQTVESALRPAIGSMSGRDACGDAATQCFTSLMLDVINPRAEGDDRRQRYEFESGWASRVRSVADLGESEIRTRHPWCAAVYPYLLPPQANGGSRDDDLDAPCRRGVEIARTNAVQAIQFIATDNTIVER